MCVGVILFSACPSGHSLITSFCDAVIASHLIKVLHYIFNSCSNLHHTLTTSQYIFDRKIVAEGSVIKVGREIPVAGIPTGIYR